MTPITRTLLVALISSLPAGVVRHRCAAGPEDPQGRVSLGWLPWVTLHPRLLKPAYATLAWSKARMSPLSTATRRASRNGSLTWLPNW